VDLRPILSYRYRGVIYLTNQVNLVSSMEQDVDGCMKVRRKDVLYQVSGLPRLTRFRNVVVYCCGAQRILDLENHAT
jgi:hypothetical protein